MSIKSDLQKYKQGDKAAEMRLLSFISELGERGDIGGLELIAKEGGALEQISRKAIAKCAALKRKHQDDKKLKKDINKKIYDLEYLLAMQDKNARAAAQVILRYLLDVRWRLIPDQETYNIDLKIRQAKEKAGKLGIRA